MCMMALGGIVSAVGSIASAMGQKAVANYNAKVAKMNAVAAVQEGNYRSGITRRQYEEVAGAQQAAMAKSGVVLDVGTPQVISTEQSFRTEQAAGIDIWQGQSEATKYRNEAKLYKAQGKAAMMSGIIGAASSLIGSLSGMGSPASASGGSSTGPVGLGVASPASVKPVPLFTGGMRLYSTPAYGYSGFGGPR